MNDKKSLYKTIFLILTHLIQKINSFIVNSAGDDLNRHLPQNKIEKNVHNVMAEKTDKNLMTQKSINKTAVMSV